MSCINFVLFLLLFTCLKGSESEYNRFSTERISQNNASVGIVNGQESRPHSAKYMVYLLVEDFKGIVYSCGGVLISPYYILTAAHCVSRKVSADVVLGAHDIMVLEITQKEFMNVSELIPHPRYGFYYDNDYDIGLIRLPEPVQETDYIKYAKLPSYRDIQRRLVGMNGTAYGWGRVSDREGSESDYLRQVNVTIIGSQECKDRLDGTDTVIFNDNLCTSGASQRGTCKGDSGGPLIVDGVVVALTSSGPDECTAGRPSVFINVAPYLQWIKSYSYVNAR